MMRVVRWCSVACLLAAISGCKGKPEDLREWTPADHTHQTESGNTGRAPRTIPRDEEAARDLSAAIWRQECANCHGETGRGDGPQSAMVQARDLTDPAWQESASDAVLGIIIREGKGKMPAFRYPDTTIQALVAHVRRLGRVRGNSSNRQPNTPANVTSPAPGSGATAPAGDAPPSTPAAPAQ